MPNKIAIHKRQSYCVFQRVAKKQKYNQLSLARGFSSGSIFVVICFCLVGVLYLFTVNAVATKGNETSQLSKDIEELKKENERLILKEAELKSLDRIKDSVKDKMKVVSEPIYIDAESLIVSK